MSVNSETSQAPERNTNVFKIMTAQVIELSALLANQPYFANGSPNATRV